VSAYRRVGVSACLLRGVVAFLFYYDKTKAREQTRRHADPPIRFPPRRPADPPIRFSLTLPGNER
jgi:hypothetical protein